MGARDRDRYRNAFADRRGEEQLTPPLVQASYGRTALLLDPGSPLAAFPQGLGMRIDTGFFEFLQGSPTYLSVKRSAIQAIAEQRARVLVAPVEARAVAAEERAAALEARVDVLEANLAALQIQVDGLLGV